MCTFDEDNYTFGCPEPPHERPHTGVSRYLYVLPFNSRGLHETDLSFSTTLWVRFWGLGVDTDLLLWLGATPNTMLRTDSLGRFLLPAVRAGINF
jgi:hypothetical protein